IEELARMLAADLKVKGVDEAPPMADDQAKWIAAVARDLKGRPKGSTLVITGAGQPPVVHALVHAINDHLGNVNKTVVYIRPTTSFASGTDTPGSPRNPAPLVELVKDMNSHQVKLLLILGGNPVFTAPADFEFGKAMASVPLRVHLGL